MQLLNGSELVLDPTFDMTPPTLNMQEVTRGMGSHSAIFVYDAALAVLMLSAAEV